MSTNTPASATTGRNNATIDSHAEPVDVSIGGDGTTQVEVHLTPRDREGTLLFDKARELGDPLGTITADVRIFGGQSRE